MKLASTVLSLDFVLNLPVFLCATQQQHAGVFCECFSFYGSEGLRHFGKMGLHEGLGIDCFWKCSLNKCVRQCRTLKMSAVLKQLIVSFTLERDSELDAPSVGAIVTAPRGSPAPGMK